MVGISMALTPLLLIGITRLLREMPARTGSTPRPDFADITDHQPKVLVAGMRRFGQIGARPLVAQRLPFVSLEQNIATAADRTNGRAVGRDRGCESGWTY